MKHVAKVAERAEDLDAQHQHDGQGLEAHRPVDDAEGTDGECAGGTQRDGAVGDAAGRDADRQHPHGRPRQIGRALAKGARPVLGLAEGGESRQALTESRKSAAKAL